MPSSPQPQAQPEAASTHACAVPQPATPRTALLAAKARLLAPWVAPHLAWLGPEGAWRGPEAAGLLVPRPRALLAGILPLLLPRVLALLPWCARHARVQPLLAALLRTACRHPEAQLPQSVMRSCAVFRVPRHGCNSFPPAGKREDCRSLCRLCLAALPTVVTQALALSCGAGAAHPGSRPAAAGSRDSRRPAAAGLGSHPAAASQDSLRRPAVSRGSHPAAGLLAALQCAAGQICCGLARREPESEGSCLDAPG